MIDIFNIIWRNVNDNLIPWFWRDIRVFRENAKNYLWLAEFSYCVLISIENLTDRLYQLAFELDLRLRYTGQVAILEFCLNDYFDNTQRRITVTDATGAYNFFVNVPTGLSYNTDRMVQIIDRYRTAGKTYNIVTV